MDSTASQTTRLQLTYAKTIWDWDPTINKNVSSSVFVYVYENSIRHDKKWSENLKIMQDSKFLANKI